MVKGCRRLDQRGAGYTLDLCKSDGVGSATRVRYDEVSPPELDSMSKCNSALGSIDTSGSCAGQVGGRKISKRRGRGSRISLWKRMER